MLIIINLCYYVIVKYNKNESRREVGVVMKKRNIILLVTGFLLLSILIAKKTQAAELTEPLTFQINDFTYSVITVATDVSEGSVGIVSYKGTENSLVLPSTVTYEDKVYKVTEITGW